MRVPVQSAAIRRTGYTAGAMAPVSAGVGALAETLQREFDEHLVGFKLDLQNGQYPCVCPSLNNVAYVPWGKSCYPDPALPTICIPKP